MEAIEIIKWYEVYCVECETMWFQDYREAQAAAKAHRLQHKSGRWA